MSKHIYRTTGVKAANWEWIAEQARTEGPVVYGVDAAKEEFVGALRKHGPGGDRDAEVVSAQ